MNSTRRSVFPIHGVLLYSSRSVKHHETGFPALLHLVEPPAWHAENAGQLDHGPSRRCSVVLRGMQSDCDTPDLTTGVYHEYDLKRVLILVNHKGRQVLISVSKQMRNRPSERKGLFWATTPIGATSIRMSRGP